LRNAILGQPGPWALPDKLMLQRVEGKRATFSHLLSLFAQLFRETAD
jgi:hypothetical protein